MYQWPWLVETSACLVYFLLVPICDISWISLVSPLCGFDSHEWQMLRGCPNMTLAVERDVKPQSYYIQYNPWIQAFGEMPLSFNYRRRFICDLETQWQTVRYLATLYRSVKMFKTSPSEFGTVGRRMWACPWRIQGCDSVVSFSLTGWLKVSGVQWTFLSLCRKFTCESHMVVERTGVFCPTPVTAGYTDCSVTDIKSWKI